jgi:nitrite reductase/ring-hydroxylating ferredoxin subunit
MPEQQVIASHPDSALPHVGTYRRVLPVSLERMYENTLDWEHLPHVHESSFREIRCLEAGPWGWRADVVSSRGVPSTIELRLDRQCRRWITRTLSGRNKGAEIWTHAFPIEQTRVDIVVDFFVPGVDADARDEVGSIYARLYQRLYDEDVAMMVGRQKALDRRIGMTGSRERGLRLDRKNLQLPLECEVDGRPFVLAEVAGELVTYPALCPHQLGPLGRSAVKDGTVTCPWHGYRFDLVTGAAVSGQTCRFGPRPTIEESDGVIVLSF